MKCGIREVTMSEFKKYIKETSLSRVWRQMKKFDSGTITAFRNARDCGNGAKYTRNENLKRNKSMLAKLQNEGYSVTRVKGSYIENYKSENAREVGEIVFFVVDITDSGKLKEDLIKFGEMFEQDSILFIPKGGEEGFLIGTNKCPDAYPGYKKVSKLKNPMFGKTGEFFTRVNGRPFVLKEDFDMVANPSGFFGKWGCYLATRTDWEKL